ncbi:glycosyltransferase family 25 protein [Egbenema bharatensis]|uniref:glycosyltransferase family 25 protein n=1 Tax=Egbenema bharatensis TaxID=3463334 RepID=UPI003A8B43D7
MPSQSPLLDFFDKAYIINLPERFDRREAMKQELKRLGSVESPEKVIFFPAIKPADRGKFPSVGSRGCFLSHLEVLREAKKQKLNNLLIMEDDLSFTRFLIEQQNAIVNELQQLDWDFAYLGHGINFTQRGESIFQSYSEALTLAHFLAVNQTTIAQLVDFLETVLMRPPGHPAGGPMHVDGAYSTLRRQNPEINTVLANPSLGFQRSSPSNIAGYKWFETVPVFAQPVGVARKVKNWCRQNFTA